MPKQEDMSGGAGLCSVSVCRVEFRSRVLLCVQSGRDSPGAEIQVKTYVASGCGQCGVKIVIFLLLSVDSPLKACLSFSLS